MIGRVGAVGRLGSPGGSWGRSDAAPPAAADFILSNANVATQWGLVTVGQLLPVNAPAGSFFRLVESAGTAGDDSGFAVVNG